MAKTPFVVMHAPNHGPTVTPEILQKALNRARKERVSSIGFTEAYNRIPYLRSRKAWDMIRGVSKTDTRRGPKDNPILIRKNRKVLEEIKVKACKGVPSSSRVAPERWIHGVVSAEEVGTVLRIQLHPHAAVMKLGPTNRRLLQYQAEWRLVEKIVREAHAKYGKDLHVVITGDFNANSSFENKYGPKKVAERLGLKVSWHGIDGAMYSPSLHLEKVETISEAEQGKGQDHPWLIFHFLG